MSSLRAALSTAFGLAALASAYDGKGEDAVVGAGGPWGLPTDVFQQAITQNNATGLFKIPGFNLSSPPDEEMAETPEWTVHVAIVADVSLSQATSAKPDTPDTEEGGDEDDRNEAGALDKTNSTTAITSFRIDAPEPAIINNKRDVNTLCASITFGLNSDSTRDGQSDAEDEEGSCEFMSKECRDGLVEAAKKAGSACDDVKIPSTCEDYFNKGVGMESFEMTPEILGANRFFSFGSQAAAKDNDTEFDTAVTNVWPVLFSWHHEGPEAEEGGASSMATLRCLRANIVASTSRQPDGVPDRGDEEDSNKEEVEPSMPTDMPEDDEDDESAAGGFAVPITAVGVALATWASIFTVL